MSLTLPTPFTRLLASLILTIPIALPGADAAAADREEPPLRSYFAFIAGASFVPNQTLTDGSTGMSRIESDPGFVVGGALGTHLFDAFRAEIAVDYREADTDEAALFPPPVTTDGETSLLSVMLNAYYDLDLGLPVTPYVGGGVGWGRFAIDVRRKTPGEFRIEDHDDVLVYNAMAGLIAPVSQAASIALGYRYVAAEGTESMGAVIGDVDQDIEAEFDAHEVTLGLRFHF